MAPTIRTEREIPCLPEISVGFNESLEANPAKNADPSQSAKAIHLNIEALRRTGETA
jgi:hypothetical protein